ncbi:hemerythrin domain-containing protein [Herbidospora mongoliensis]|uniref:hemerythrin domain-containing protein n=1 Tax=Herbidospora mongoliensis TaxID=688067 RepID=UPI00082A70A3|nr:hemerythrin domain-containing protein [Herbidospora mongoliensis]
MDRHTTVERGRDLDVIIVLTRQHALIRDLFDEVERSQPADRRETFERLRRLLAVHEEAEEVVVHPVALARLNGGAEIVANRRTEARKVRELLTGLDPDSHDFTRHLEILRAWVFAHVTAEERYEYCALDSLTSAAERHVMAEEVRETFRH